MISLIQVNLEITLVLAYRINIWLRAQCILQALCANTILKLFFHKS